jgi:hypothetical protein
MQSLDELIKHIPGLSNYTDTPAYQSGKNSPTTLEGLLSLIQPWDGIRRVGDRVVSRWTMSATHKSGKPVVLKGVSIARFVNGKISEEWVSMDNAALVAQLAGGAEPPARKWPSSTVDVPQ